MSENAKVIDSATSLKVSLPLTQPTGKIRVKQRNLFCEYGIPVASRKEVITQSMYVEWQIGYDLLATSENKGNTSINDKTFKNYKGEIKYAYELSEIVLCAYNKGIISEEEIINVVNKINAVNDANLLDVIDSMRITRTNPIECTINDMSFYEMKVSYPLVVHKFGKYDIYAEVINREKQRAVGVQPMLYVCLPISVITFKSNVYGRILNVKECGEWIIQRDEALLSLELFRIFGMLSAKHKFDTLAIFKMLFDFVN